MPSKRVSSARVDYVPALCTHRPSLLPIEWLSEAFGLPGGGRQRPPQSGKLSKLGHLEEVKVVTRSPLVNQRRDHYKKRRKAAYNHREPIHQRCFGGSARGPGLRAPGRGPTPGCGRPPEVRNSSASLWHL